MFRRRFPNIGQMRILDLGGYAGRWREFADRPAQVITLNLDRQEQPSDDWAKAVTGDACSPPDWLRREQFDLVFSNSLLEHVGGHSRREDLAGVVHTLAPHHWIQTPYRYFPVEAHWLFPGFQFLPVTGRAAVAARWPFGSERSHPSEAVRDVLSVEFLSATEMRYYFPDSQIVHEKFVGLTKSLIAVR